MNIYDFGHLQGWLVIVTLRRVSKCCEKIVFYYKIYRKFNIYLLKIIWFDLVSDGEHIDVFYMV